MLNHEAEATTMPSAGWGSPKWAAGKAQSAEALVAMGHSQRWPGGAGIQTGVRRQPGKRVGYVGVSGRSCMIIPPLTILRALWVSHRYASLVLIPPERSAFPRVPADGGVPIWKNAAFPFQKLSGGVQREIVPEPLGPPLRLPAPSGTSPAQGAVG